MWNIKHLHDIEIFSQRPLKYIISKLFYNPFRVCGTLTIVKHITFINLITLYLFDRNLQIAPAKNPGSQQNTDATEKICHAKTEKEK